MKVSKIKIENFRLLENVSTSFNDSVTWLVGKNNTGKTSFAVLMDHFFNSSNYKFDFNDFSKSKRDLLLNIDEETDVNSFSIKLLLWIVYEKNDNLINLSEFINDLSVEKNEVKIGLEAVVNKKRLLDKISGLVIEEKKEYIKKNISDYIDIKISIFNDESDFYTENRNNLIEKDLKSLKKVINYQLINAKRDVTSSEDHASGRKVLSNIITKYYNSLNDSPELKDINHKIFELDKELDENYNNFFKDFLSNTNRFLNDIIIKIESDLQSKFLMSNMSKVVYGLGDDTLPEYLNGLGYTNILYLLLNIEVSKSRFKQDNSDINILCIEEPEAHTHPQLQYIFAREIEQLISGINNLQTIITTHSSYMITQCKFDNLRYFKNSFKIEIIDFDATMKEVYKDNDDYYNFLQKYLSIESAELFFADKVIFIEGLSERILINYFMKSHDLYLEKLINDEKEKAIEEKRSPNVDILNKEHELLLSQNISILEVGANAKTFDKFFEILGIKCLIITDIDSVKKGMVKEKMCNVISSVEEGYYSSNSTLKHFFPIDNTSTDEERGKWFDEIKEGNGKISDKLMLAYQHKVEAYYPRTFEDAFIYENLDKLFENKENFSSLNFGELSLQKIKDKIINKEFFNFTMVEDDFFDKKNKSLFSSEIYMLSSNFEKSIEWNTPKYIKDGLEWLAK